MFCTSFSSKCTENFLFAEAGVDVEFHLYPGAYHGFEGINPDAELSIRAKDDYILAVKNGFKRSRKIEV